MMSCSYLRKETARRPGDARLWAALADVVADRSGAAAGLAVVDEAQAAAGDSPEVRLARRKLYAAEPGRVRPLAPLAERIESWPEADQLRLLYGLVEVFDQVDDQASVIQMLQRHRGTPSGRCGRLVANSRAGHPVGQRCSREAGARRAGEARGRQWSSRSALPGRDGNRARSSGA